MERFRGHNAGFDGSGFAGGFVGGLASSSLQIRKLKQTLEFEKVCHNSASRATAFGVNGSSWPPADWAACSMRT